MLTSWYGDAFCITAPLCGESVVDFPHERSWYGALIFLFNKTEQAIEQLVELPLILDSKSLMCRHCDDVSV